ncbi:hypothetical protein KI387_030593, partial [Taxus chinensis]
ARQQLTMRDRMPPLLERMRPHVTAVQWVVMREVGLDVESRGIGLWIGTTA